MTGKKSDKANPEEKPKKKNKRAEAIPEPEELEEIRQKYSMSGVTTYTEEIGDWVCDLIATHPYGLDKIRAMNPGFPSKATVFYWKYKIPSFSDKYHKAKLAQADIMPEECVDIADDVSNDKKINSNGDEITNNEAVNRSRLKVDTRKWLASKLLPKQYGDQKRVEELESQNDVMRKQLDELRAMLDEKNKKDY